LKEEILHYCENSNFLALISDNDFVIYLIFTSFCSFGMFAYGFSNIKSKIHMKTWVEDHRFENYELISK